MNYMVLRQSPDWLNFDMEETRSFCARLGFPEDLIIDFAARWDRCMALSFKEYRAEMKRISLATIEKLEKAQIINGADLVDANLADGDLITFSDDDDWVDNQLFVDVSNVEGGLLLWGSIFVGRVYTQTPQARVDDPAVDLRALDGKTVFTNNYMVRGELIKRYGISSLIEHFDAQELVDKHIVNPTTIPVYSSAANKHPCCTMAILFNMKSEAYRNDISGHLRRFNADLMETKIPEEAGWIAAPLAEFIDINKVALSN